MTDHYHLPYEEVPDGPINLDIRGYFVDQVHLRSAVMDTPIGRLPLLVFNFESSAHHTPPLAPIIFAGPPEGPALTPTMPHRHH